MRSIIAVLFAALMLSLAAEGASAQNTNPGSGDAFVNDKDVNGGAPGCPFEDEVS